MSGMKMVYVSPVPWAHVAQRSHQLVQWFHQHTQGSVYWIDPDGPRFPRWDAVYRGRISGHSPAPSDNTPPEWLKVVKPRAFSRESVPGLGALHRWMWQPLVQQVSAWLNNPRVPGLITIGKPSVLALQLIQACPGHYTLYDAMENFAAGYTRFVRRAMERHTIQLIQQVDTVWTASQRLQSCYQAFRTDVQWVPNGVDITALPPPIAAPAAPIWGYVGTQGRWLDWEWLIHLAQARPLDRVHVVTEPTGMVPRDLPPNIACFPACTHNVVLKVMQTFRVGLIPFRCHPATDTMDPAEYYGYRALGIPVLSTPCGEMAQRDAAAGTFISRSHTDLPELAAAAWDYHEELRQTVHFAKTHAWHTRFQAACWIPETVASGQEIAV